MQEPYQEYIFSSQAVFAEKTTRLSVHPCCVSRNLQQTVTKNNDWAGSAIEMVGQQIVGNLGGDQGRDVFIVADFFTNHGG